MLITDLNTAEMIKHSSNAFLALKISFINMVSDLCEAAGANVTDVAAGLGLDPRDWMPFSASGNRLWRFLPAQGLEGVSPNRYLLPIAFTIEATHDGPVPSVLPRGPTPGRSELPN